MKYFVIFLILIGFAGTVYAQYMGDSGESSLIWPPVCIGGPGMCPPYDEWIKEFFNDAISGPFDQSDNVIVGTIIEIETLDTSLRYSIQVDFYLKNVQSFDLLTATLDNPGEPKTFPEVLSYNSPIFDKDDLVLVYLKKINGEYKVLPQSFAIDKHEVRGPPPTIFLTTSPQEGNYEQGQEILFSGVVRKAELYQAAKKGETLDVKLTIHDKNNTEIFSDLLGIDSDGNYNYKLPTSNLAPEKYEIEIKYGPASTSYRITLEPNLKYWTPLKQFKSGIPIDEIDCKNNFVVAIKNANGNPACVKPETKIRLMERGWAEPLGEVVFQRTVKPEPKPKSEPQCAFYFEKLQEKITDIRKTNFATVSAYLEQLDSALEFKKKILELECLSDVMPWFHLVTATEKIPNPSQIEIESTYDKVIKVTNNVLIIPEHVVPWKIVEYLEQQRIEYEIVPYEFAQTDEGWTDPTRLCSTLRFLNGTDFYASATFHPEPLGVTGIFIDLERPKDCQKYFDLPQ